MSKKSTRAARRAAREAKRRRDRNRRLMIIGGIVAVMIVAIVAPVYFTVLRSPSPGNTPDTGLQIEDLVVGTGAEAQPGRHITVDYTGWLEDGTKFDSSIDRGQPYEFNLGEGGVIQGWDQGIPGMKVGGMRKLTIPPELAYGEIGAGPIPPNATLIFEVQLLAVE